MRLRFSAALGIVTCTLFIGSDSEAAELKRRDFRELADEMGVVLLDVNWGRSWNCGGYENAQLLLLRFEHELRDPDNHNDYSQIVLETPSRLFAAPTFRNYGFILEPGTYIFTEWGIRAAESLERVGSISATRNDLVDGTEVLGGSFHVGSGEVIYIGNLWIDCYDSPIPWRYFSELGPAFEAHAAEYLSEFKFLEDTLIQYRLMDTEIYGVLPEQPDAANEAKDTGQ